MPKRALTYEEERQLVADYNDPDTKVLDIVDRYGIARQTLYDILERHGVRPGRQASGDYPEGISTLTEAYAWAMRRVLEQEKELGRLEAVLGRKEEVIEDLLLRLGSRSTPEVNAGPDRGLQSGHDHPSSTAETPTLSHRAAGAD